MPTTNFKELFDGAQATLRDNPDEAEVTFRVASRGIDGFRRTARVRDFDVPADEPASLGGTDAAPNPVEYALVALATCQEITYRLYADALGIPLDDVSVSLEGRLDLRGLFDADDNARPGFSQIDGTVTLRSKADAATLARLKRHVDEHCPVLDLFRYGVPVNLDIAAEHTAPAAAAAE